MLKRAWTNAWDTHLYQPIVKDADVVYHTCWYITRFLDSVQWVRIALYSTPNHKGAFPLQNYLLIHSEYTILDTNKVILLVRWSSLFWDVKQHWLVVSYQRFGTAYWYQNGGTYVTSLQGEDFILCRLQQLSSIIWQLQSSSWLLLPVPTKRLGIITRGAQIWQKSRSHLKILGVRSMTWSKLHTEDQQILDATTQNLAPMTTSCPGILHSW